MLALRLAPLVGVLLLVSGCSSEEAPDTEEQSQGEESGLAPAPSVAATPPPANELSYKALPGAKITGEGYAAIAPDGSELVKADGWDYAIRSGDTTTTFRALEGTIDTDAYGVVDERYAVYSSPPFQDSSRVGITWDGVSSVWLVRAKNVENEAYEVSLIATFGDELVEVRASTEEIPEGDAEFVYPDTAVMQTVYAR